MGTQFDDSLLWQLPTAERASLAQRLLESLHADAYAAPLTAEQVREINRRIADADAGELVGEPWSQVERELAAAK